MEKSTTVPAKGGEPSLARRVEPVAVIGESKIMTSCTFRIVLYVTATSLVAGCLVGPEYHTPPAAVPQAYKELTPANFKNTQGWSVSHPRDDALRGNWWEIFNNPQLNTLEQQVNVSNQNLAAAAANFFAARALVKEARAQLYPTLTTNPGISRQLSSSTLSPGTSGGSASASAGAFTDYLLPFDATWQPDLFGRIRNSVKAAASGAQASAADLENTRLTLQAAVAADYFQLRGEDSLKQLLRATVVSFQEAADLTRVLYQTGIGTDESVAQAETQLQAAQAQETAVGIQRAQFEHAIAMLTGQPASSFSLPVEPLTTSAPAIPFGVPSQLLERRPDIAAAERLVAQANAQIGIAEAAYFPTITLSASAGLESTALATWLTWPSRFFSVGPSAMETLFDAGLRRATVEQFKAQYDQAVANYRQAVLTAFQQVEDHLSALGLLSVEIQYQERAVTSAQRSLALATERYKVGIDPYLNVLTAQTTLLSNQQTAINLRIQQMTESVGLIEALGGGWHAAQLPTPAQLTDKTTNGQAQ